MRQRLISAAVLVPVVVIIFVAGEPWLSLGILLLACLAAFETARLVRLAGLGAPTWLAVVGAGAAVVIAPFAIGAYSQPTLGPVLLLGYIALVPIVAAIAALGRTEPRAAFNGWVGTILAILYPGLLAFLLAVLYAAPPESPGAPLVGILDSGRRWLLVLVLTVWSTDTFAYVTGRTFPRGRMAPSISPNKTWSGAIGGTIAAVIICSALVWAVGENPVAGAVLGLIIAVASQAGDLTESVLKRTAEVKDSGNLIPGHGGILDRLDSFLFAAPALVLTLLVFRELNIW